MLYYEIEYRPTPTADDLDDDRAVQWRSHPERPLASESGFVIEGLELGEYYDVRCRFVDPDTGAISGWREILATLIVKDGTAPPALASLRLTKGDCVTGEIDIEVVDLRGYRLRHAPGVHQGGTIGWNTAEKAHEDIFTDWPFLLCRVPKGPRTLLGVPVDWDDNEGPPLTLMTHRGPIDDRGEYTIRTVDHAANDFADGTLTGGTSSGGVLTASALSTAPEPMFPSGIEPWMSADGDSPMFPLDPDALMFGETWGDGAAWFADDGADLMFGDLFEWVEYVFPFTVHAGEEGPRSALSVDCASGAVGWRLQYRLNNSLAWFDPDPYALMFSATGGDPMFTAQSPKYWRPWPGRLQPVEVGRYDFRLIVPGGPRQYTVTALAVTVSSDPLTERTEGLSIPANGGTRHTPATRATFRKIVEVEARQVGTDDPMTVVTTHKSPASGPAFRAYTSDGAVETTTLVDVTVRGY